MMGNTDKNWKNLSDLAIVNQLGQFIKHSRHQQNHSQAHLAKKAGLNRWTISQIENGESINLTSLIQILRALDNLHVFQSFEYSDEISPIAYAKLKREQKQRVRTKKSMEETKEDLGW